MTTVTRSLLLPPMYSTLRNDDDLNPNDCDLLYCSVCELKRVKDVPTHVRQPRRGSEQEHGPT